MTIYRLAIVTSHPIQYQAPLFRLLAQHPQIDLTVYFGHDASLNNAIDRGFGVPVTWDIPLLEGYQYVILKEKTTSFDDSDTEQTYSRLIKYFRNEHYDAVLIHGYANSLARWAYLGAWLSRTPVLLHGESEIFAPRSRLKYLARSLYLVPFLRGTAAFLTIGHANQAFYQAYYISEKRMLFTPYAVDNTFFQAENTRLLPLRDTIRAKWGFHPGQPVIVFSGKLIERKRPLDLLAAYLKVCATGIDAGLLYIGDGELRTQLETEINHYQLQNVKIAGFQNQSEISSGYVCGDVFVLPSRYETWGLVVNEAMNFAMPVIVSDQVGAGRDLVRENETGYVFPMGQVDRLADMLINVLKHPHERMLMGQNALELVNQYSFEADVDGIVAALHTISSTPI